MYQRLQGNPAQMTAGDPGPPLQLDRLARNDDSSALMCLPCSGRRCCNSAPRAVFHAGWVFTARADVLHVLALGVGVRMAADDKAAGLQQTSGGGACDGVRGTRCELVSLPVQLEVRTRCTFGARPIPVQVLFRRTCSAACVWWLMREKDIRRSGLVGTLSGVGAYRTSGYLSRRKRLMHRSLGFVCSHNSSITYWLTY